MVIRIDSTGVTVAPVDSHRVAAHRFDVQHLQRWLVHLERRSGLGRVIRLLRFRAVSARASSTRAFVSEVSHAIATVVAAGPVDFDPF